VARALVNVPKTAKRGEIVDVKALISHPMETGYRPGPNGRLLARDIIDRFACTYNGTEVFAIDLHPAMSANPYLAFSVVATESGTLTMTWSGDNGFRQSETVAIEVA
jgi:sulfur-oxidizing protein SoxZ